MKVKELLYQLMGLNPETEVLAKTKVKSGEMSEFFDILYVDDGASKPKVDLVIETR